jgi:hypothetical protein
MSGGGWLREVCTECDWTETWSGGPASDDPAIAHAAATGHTVKSERAAADGGESR